MRFPPLAEVTVSAPSQVAPPSGELSPIGVVDGGDRYQRMKWHIPKDCTVFQPLTADDASPLCHVAFVKDGPVRRVERYAVQVPRAYRVPYTGEYAARFPDGFPLAVTSGLAFAGVDAQGRWLLRSITDRGPNGDAPKYEDGSGTHSTKVFAQPEFAPLIGMLRVRSGCRVDLISAEPMKHQGVPITGRPIPPGDLGATGEVPLSDKLGKIAFDPNGLDPEGIAIDRDGNFWVADEYGPFLVHVDHETHEVLDKLGPGSGLPEAIRSRPANRGFEGCAVSPAGTVFAAIQSPIEVKAGAETYVHLIAFDPKTRATRTFGVRLDAAQYLDLREAKIGDISVIDEDRLLAIEQGKDSKGIMQNWVSVIDLRGADDLSVEIEGGPRLASLTRLLDLREYGWTHEKAEALAIIDDTTIAVGNDNDFGLTATMGDSGVLPSEHVIDENGVVLDAEGRRVKRDYRLEPASAESATQELWIFRLRAPP